MSDLTDSLGILNTSVQFAGANVGQSSNRKFIRQENQKARDFTLEMWNKANEFNMPSAVMQRYKDAGLNANLIYDNGTNNLAAYQGAPSHSAPNTYSSDFVKSLDILAQLQASSQIDVNEALADKYKSEAEGQEIQNEVNTEQKENLKSIIQNTAYKLEQDGLISEAQAKTADIIWQDMDKTFDAKTRSYFLIPDSYDVREGEYKEGKHLLDENGEILLDEDGNPMFYENYHNAENYWFASMYMYQQALEQNGFSRDQSAAMVGNILTDTELKVSQIGLNGALQIYNYELATTQHSIRAQIASEIRKNEQLMKVLQSEIGLNNAQAKALLDNVATGVANYNLDALKYNTTGRYGGNFSIFFNVLQDILYQHKDNNHFQPQAPYIKTK